MDISQKLDILSRDAQYDLSCSCCTNDLSEHRKKNAAGDGWLYPVTVANGGRGIMLKTLMSNSCENDCKYCPLRSNQDFLRLGLGPDELARFFLEMCAKKDLIGLFLSSAVAGSADCTMDRLIATAQILRKKYQYKGYIHLKIIPGASKEAIDQALDCASAVSLNIETPGQRHFDRLCSSKSYQNDVIESLKYIASQTAKGQRHSKVKTSSQFIVGASDETDREIADYSWAMYQRLGMRRIYYSAYQKGLGDPSIPGERKPLVLEKGTLFPVKRVDDQAIRREHRLYQVDFLYRQYGFSASDIITSDGSLDLARDPKQVWADNHPEAFPVDIGKADKETLLKVPGIGPILARKILAARKSNFVISKDCLPARAQLYLA